MDFGLVTFSAWYLRKTILLLCFIFSSHGLFSQVHHISTLKKRVLPLKKNSFKKKIRRKRKRRIIIKRPVIRKRRFRGISSSSLGLSKVHVPVEFTKTYSKFFGVPYLPEQGKISPVKIWVEENTKPFTELIISWNALRPIQGSFVFKGSVKTINGWGPWYKFAEWKKDSQLTFFNSRATDVHVKSVRLEVQRNMLGHGFRVMVEAKDGADISNIHALFGCVSDLRQYKMNHGIAALPSVILKDVPRQSQMVLDHPRSKDLCCPTSMAMIVRYFNTKYDGVVSKPLHQEAVDFADLAHDHGADVYGSWPLNIAQAYEAAKGRVFFRAERLNSFKDLHEYLNKKIPVSVSVRGLLRGGAKTYNSGHYMVVVGWNADKQTILCIDPAFGASKRTLRAYDARHFLAAWSRSRNLSYISLPRQDFGEF